MVNGNPMGPVCATKAPIVPPVGRDLFGYDVEAEAKKAKQRLCLRISVLYERALHDMRIEFAEARGRLGL